MKTLIIFLILICFYIHQLGAAPLPFYKSMPHSKLALLKKNENEKKWKACWEMAAGVYSKKKIIQPWVLLTWIKCGRNLPGSNLEKVLNILDRNSNWLREGPWKTALLKEMFFVREGLINEKIERKGAFRFHLEKLFLYEDLLDKDARSKLNLWLGMEAFSKKEYREADFFFNQALELNKNNKIARSKQQELSPFINSANSSVTPTNSQTTGVNEFSPELAAEAAPPALVSVDEKKWIEKVKEAADKGEILNFVSLATSYIKIYPQGALSHWSLERILSSYEKLDNPDLEAEVLERMEEADGLRLYEWLRYFHKKGEYKACLQFAKKALESLKTTATAANLYYLGGRSAQFLGDYKLAQEYFESYIHFFHQGEELAEVLYRLGLVHLRQKKYEAALVPFDQMLSLSSASVSLASVLTQRDRFESGARYWILRSLEKLLEKDKSKDNEPDSNLAKNSKNRERWKNEREILISKFPLTYYGMRVLAEKNQNFYEWPLSLKKASNLKVNYPLYESQKKILARLILLRDHFWFVEAHQEISLLPGAMDPETKLALAGEWALAQNYPLAIKLLNEAFEKDLRLKNWEYVTLAYPQIFKKEIDHEAQKNKMSSYLVKSLIRQESAFGPRQVSSSNAMGLMQLIPPTAREVAADLRLVSFDLPESAFEVDINVKMGSYYLAKVIREWGGQVPLGLASYNAGPHKVKSFIKLRPDLQDEIKSFSSDPFVEMWFDELPWSETSSYVKAILRNVIIYKALDQRRVDLKNGIWQDLLIR